MSSILKALKKIEGRKVDGGLPAWPYGAGSLESTDRHIHRSRQRQKILGLLIILCGIALAGKLYIGSRPDTDKTATQSAPATEAALPEKPLHIAQPEAPKTVAVTSRSAPEPRPEQPPSETSSETAPPPVISPSPVESEETATTDESPAAAVEETLTTTITETFAAPPADNAGMSLMALVWSRQPESRFVVINGNIVREGGSIEESTVVRIGEDYVVMRTGGITWKLK